MLTVKDYLSYFRQESYEALFDKESIDKIKYVEAAYGSRETEETILEVNLSMEEKGCDYSIRIDTDHAQVKEYWYELDFAACQEDAVNACYFIDASAVIPGEEHEAFLSGPLTELAGKERVARLKKMLLKCIDALSGKCSRLFQFGAMTARGENDSIRLFTEDLLPGDLVTYLSEIGWKGNTEKLSLFLKACEPYCDGGKFILDFDVWEDRISDRIGINLGTRKKDSQTVSEWLSFLEEQGLCHPAKKKDVMRFVERYPSHTPFIQNDISHFKIPFCNGKPLSAKAYLRQGSVCYYGDFRAYDTPAIMNLELTTRCPLRCPQCYCDLTKGKELDLERARYWIVEASRCMVRTVNLSGGETMCYPHIYELIELCRQRGMEPNVALSGYGIDEGSLKKIIKSGVEDICVSLNGSTEEVNRRTRDGYELAVHTLSLLKAMAFPRTCINWVMHSLNAEDFPQMLALAEEYHVSRLVVMAFKPDAAHQLSSVPDGEQIRKIAGWIKKYKGRVGIEVEECFSPLRALLGERFLINKNRGIDKGCGAGRDGISVNVEGRLTPCRHLELPEEYASIREYWKESSVLLQLRSVEDHQKEPCSACKYHRHCLPCMAVNWKMKGEISMGDELCPLKREDRLILVDYQDQPIGEAGKLEVHQKSLLHRAFSVFLYRGNELLIQKRAAGKYHSAGLWANTCCSHPRVGEELTEAVKRRLQEEAGITCPVEELTAFVYREVYGELAEYEYDHVFVGEYDGAFQCNHEEAEEMKYVDIDELSEDMVSRPEKYAAWFLTAFPMVYRHLKGF